MLTIRSRAIGRDCEGNTRRDFLRVGSLALGGLTLPQLLQARDQASAASRPVNDTAVVLLWLSGGPTHIETFDPKMSAPVEYRSTVGALDTNVPGIQVGGVLPNIAKVADRMAFVRSFAHKNSSHGSATEIVMTGQNVARGPQAGVPTNPSCGSMLARHRGESNAHTGMPTYFRFGAVRGDGPAFLGKAYAPFEASGETRKNMDLTIDTDRLADRRSLLAGLDRFSRAADASGLMYGMDAYEQQAYGLLLGEAKTAFNIESENGKLRSKYGSGLGEQMLQARRLCEAGCGFVTINYGGWDMHGNVARSMQQRGSAVDQAVAAFVEDCRDRGLDKRILLVITGEFGRTPRVNKNAGRDHWGPLCTLALSGGGLRMGQVVGESSANAEVPKSATITPSDLMATLFHVLGMPQDLHFKDLSGRPVPMLNGGRPIAELV